MNNRHYKIAITLCVLFLFPTGVGLVPWYFYQRWLKQPTENNRLRLEKWLQAGLALVFIQLAIISLFFYHYGRYLIHVMGTFY